MHEYACEVFCKEPFVKLFCKKKKSLHLFTVDRSLDNMIQNEHLKKDGPF